ncbi:ABC transporter ATP-binding protein [Catenulispora subtropica]|uniref:ABC transporter ATP-binding protein n=1 Tax=Catenulispora subtropica TaxID=450798 RepID=A0ABN2RWR2_9ACTN
MTVRETSVPARTGPRVLQPAPTRPSARRPGVGLLAESLRYSRRPVLVLSWWSLLAAAPALFSGKALAGAVDRGFLAHRPAVAAFWLALFAAATLLGAWAGRQTYPPLADIVEPLRDRLLRGVVTGTLRRAAEPATPGPDNSAVAVAQITRQVEAVRDATSGQLLIVWQFAVTAVAVIVGTTALAPAAALLVALPLVLALCLFVLLVPNMIRRQRAAFLAEERLARVSVDTLGAMRDLVACGALEAGMAGAHEAVRAQAATARALARVAALRRLIVALGAHVPIVLVLLAAPALVRGGMTPGGIVGVLMYLVGVLEPALRLLVQGVGGSFLRLEIAAERLAEASRLPESRPAAEAAARPARSSVELRHVTFAYGPGAEPILRDLSLVVAPGEHVAVVGPSGIGKSTLADILAGTTVPDEGTVVLGDSPLPRISVADLYRARVLLPQDAYVFAGTLRENLGYLADRPAETEDQDLLDALARLGADELLARLGGLDAELHPAQLSLGEKQQIALARAYVSPAGLVILDEATSHLDAVAEARAEEAFRDRPGTVIVIAHRISSARRADRILLLDGSRPLIGTHAQMLAASPLYADLVGHWDPDPQ